MMDELKSPFSIILFIFVASSACLRKLCNLETWNSLDTFYDGFFFTLAAFCLALTKIYCTISNLSAIIGVS